jgi:hypothetical protein
MRLTQQKTDVGSGSFTCRGERGARVILETGGRGEPRHRRAVRQCDSLDWIKFADRIDAEVNPVPITHRIAIWIRDQDERLAPLQAVGDDCVAGC